MQIESISPCDTCSVEATGLRYQCVSAHRDVDVEKESKFIQTDPPTTTTTTAAAMTSQKPCEAFNNHLTNNSTGTSPNSESTTETGPNSGPRDQLVQEDEICIAAPLEYSNHVQPEHCTTRGFVAPPIPHHGKSRSSNSMNNRHDTRSGHARTHKIVINLDDKERFTEEVIV